MRGYNDLYLLYCLVTVEFTWLNISKKNRNALIREQEAEQIKVQTEFDSVRFDRLFEKVTGETKVATLKSGVELSGSALRILRYNAEQAEIQKDVMNYNSQSCTSTKNRTS